MAHLVAAIVLECSLEGFAIVSLQAVICSSDLTNLDGKFLMEERQRKKGGTET